MALPAEGGSGVRRVSRGTAAWAVGLAVLAAVLAPLALHGQFDVLTNRYDPQRTGANLRETKLTAATVNASRFGLLHSYPVDGAVYAQPLYAAGVTVNGAARNVLYVATMNDRVYAFDADSSSPTPLWTRNFTSPPAVVPVPISDIVAPNLNIVGNVGIQSTPVIDRASGTLYLVARTKENAAYVQRLHALDIATGASRPGSPVTIAASVPGTAPDAVAGPNGPVIVFNPRMQSQRPGLALSNGVVLVAWAGHEDTPPYHGWIMGFNSATLARVGVLAVAPDGYAGGIWQGGRAPAIDASGNVYFASGNGPWDGTRNFGNSVLKIAVSRTAGLTLLDFFTPSNHEQLNAVDNDLGGSGFTLLPGTNLLLGGGKEGVLYLLNATNLGRRVANDTQVVQKIVVSGGHVMGGPVYWNSASLGPMVYNWSEEDALTAYRLSAGRLLLPPFARGSVVSPGHPGGSLTLSANGSAAGTGIVWASMPTSQDGIHGLVAGILRAYNAETLAEIWTSEQNASRDRLGRLMKFTPPLVMNGRVYLPNHDNAVRVYGLLPAAAPPQGAIGINFAGSHPTPMAASERAGVVPQGNWNHAAAASSSAPLALRDANGAVTSATVTWSSPAGSWATPIADAPGNPRLMKGYLDTTNTSSTTVTVAGLPSRTYDVYVYVDGDNRGYTRSAAYAISGTGIAAATRTLVDAAGTNFTSTFTEANGSNGNYVRFRITAAGFTLRATPLEPTTGTRRAPVNGVQIVPVAAATTRRTISVNFLGRHAVPMGAGELAGVIAKPNWNNASGAARATPLPLVDEAGSASGAAITWSANGTWMTPIADQAGNRRMMKGYLDTSSTSTTTVSVTGLAAGAYDVYVYADGENHEFARTAAYRISGTGIVTTTVNLTDAANTNYSTAFTPASAGSAGNYVRFSISAGAFTITASPVSGGNATLRAPINGIQIVAR